MGEKAIVSKDLKRIKRFYGEDMSKFCKDNFSTFLEKPGVLPQLLLDTFAPNKSLYKDLVRENKTEEFIKYIYSFLCQPSQLIDTDKTPYELMREKKYTLFHCHSDSDIQAFKKYYTIDERLCTFNTNRYDSCHVFFAVRDDALDLNRDDFEYPSRQDEYGTSVISIQFSRGDINILSIKNRYNHKVTNPDATFSNNLEKINPGLTKSFEKRYGYNISSNFRGFELYSYMKGKDSKFYKYNYEINNIYYTTTNEILDDKVTSFDREKYILCDYFLIDLVNNKITTVDNRIRDSFVDYYNNISKIEVTKLDDNRIITIYQDDEVSYITINKENEIIGYKNDYLKKVDNNFLYYNNSLLTLSASNLREIGDCFLCNNNSLTELDISNVEEVGDDFLYSNNSISSINFKKLKIIGNSFLFCNNLIDNVELDDAVVIGNSFFASNRIIKNISLDNVIKIGNEFLFYNKSMLEINIPNLISIGNDFLFSNNVLEKLYLHNAVVIGENALCHNYSLLDYDLSSVKKLGKYFIYNHPDSDIKEKVYKLVA